ncbi:hypothetical protein LCGC14_0063000 [marine sediment metagenome]|uniref:Uncharacterized protein n=1 Tax=marine sediment metagenome TaxID=412755 RepID=A0A0F9Y3S9_9ZZZZ
MTQEPDIKRWTAKRKAELIKPGGNKGVSKANRCEVPSWPAAGWVGNACGK